jgi:hypothetical protein
MKIFEYQSPKDVGSFHIAATTKMEAYLRARETEKIETELSLAQFRRHTRVTEIVRDADVFDNLYELESNVFAPDAAWEGHWFETYGREVEFVANQDPRRVWTLVDAEDQLWIVAGRHFVNRVGYLLSKTPWRDPNETYVVAT